MGAAYFPLLLVFSEWARRRTTKNLGWRHAETFCCPGGYSPPRRKNLPWPSPHRFPNLPLGVQPGGRPSPGPQAEGAAAAAAAADLRAAAAPQDGAGDGAAAAAADGLAAPAAGDSGFASRHARNPHARDTTSRNLDFT